MRIREETYRGTIATGRQNRGDAEIMNQAPSNDMVGYYARRAREYERIFAKPERAADLATLRQWVTNSLAGRTVLEIACGTGYWTELLGHCARAVTAMDINPEMLDIARSKPIDPQRVQFRLGDAMALPRLATRFDAALAGFWWSHLSPTELSAFLNGLQRHLVPGAVVVFLDNCYVAESSTPIARTDTEGNTYQIRTLDDGSCHEVRKNFPSDDEIRAALDGRAQRVTINRLTYYWMVRYEMPES